MGCPATDKPELPRLVIDSAHAQQRPFFREHTFPTKKAGVNLVKTIFREHFLVKTIFQP